MGMIPFLYVSQAICYYWDGKILAVLSNNNNSNCKLTLFIIYDNFLPRKIEKVEGRVIITKYTQKCKNNDERAQVVFLED